MTKVFKLKDLDCPNCAAKMEQAIGKLPAVNSASVSFMGQKMVIDANDEQFDVVMQKVVKVCRKIEPDCQILLWVLNEKVN